MKRESSELASFWDHLEEFRRTLIKIAWIVLLGMGLAFAFHQPILHFLTQPFPAFKSRQQTNLEILDVKTYRTINRGKDAISFELPERSVVKHLSAKVTSLDHNKFLLSPSNYVDWEEVKPSKSLLILSPVEGFAISLKISFWLGIAITCPFWLYIIFQFIAPALHQKEKLLILPFLALSFLFITLGICFAYCVTIPIANTYFFAFNENFGINLWSLSNYIDYTFLLVSSNVIAFELFVVVLLLVHYGYLKAQKMRNKRKHVIVAAFILGALLTPPDVLSQLLMAIPMLIFYEVTIFYALYREYQYLSPSIGKIKF